MKTALFTGSFDPLTKGHLDLISRASHIFEKVIVAVGDNPQKTYLFAKTERVQFVKNNTTRYKNVEVLDIARGRLAADVAYELDAVIIKGVRATADFDYEKMMHEINHIHNQGVDTMIFPSQTSLSHISSSAAKEVCKLNGNTEDFVTLDVKARLERELLRQTRIILTGTIGAGKSAIVSHLHESRFGFPNIINVDLDILAKDILFQRTEPVYVRLREQLQEKLKIRTWDIKSVGDVIFNKTGNDENRDILNRLIKQPMLTRVREAIKDKVGLVIFNGALIVESDWMYLANNNVVVLDVASDVQRYRLIARGYTEDEIYNKVRAQIKSSAKVKMCRDAIDRDGYGTVLDVNTTNATIDDSTNTIAMWVRKNLIQTQDVTNG